MKRSLRGMKGQMPPELQQAMDGVSPENFAGMEQMVQQYQTKSEGELMEELRRITGQQRADGSLDSNQMRNMAAKLAPMLTPEQQKRMDEILRSI